MTIKKQVKSVPDEAAEQFIKGAPDAAAGSQDPAGRRISEKPVIRGNKRVITVGIDLELMPRLDAAAARLSSTTGLSISRAAFINRAILKAVENTEQS